MPLPSSCSPPTTPSSRAGSGGWGTMTIPRTRPPRGGAPDPGPNFAPPQDGHIRELLAALPARLREPFLLHYYAGFGVREIAAQLKKPEGTIKADLYHARAKLKEAIRQATSTGPMPAQRPRAASQPGGAGRASLGKKPSLGKGGKVDAS